MPNNKQLRSYIGNRRTGLQNGGRLPPRDPDEAEKRRRIQELMKQRFNRPPMSPENRRALMEGYGKTHAYGRQAEGRAYGGIIGLNSGGSIPG